MSLAVVRSRAIDGLDAPAVMVEVHLANGLPSFTLVGLADTEVKEARERVRAALQQQRVGVSAQQAHHGQSGAGRSAQGVGPLRSADRARHPGRRRPDRRRRRSTATNSPASCRWPASCARCAARWQWRWRVRREGRPRALVLPAGQRARRALADGARRPRAAHLLEVVRRCSRATPRRRWPRRQRAGRQRQPIITDLRDVKGQAGAKRALEIAAAGGHSLLMVGPPGTGKSMLAQRLPGLLPPMTEDEALASAAMQAWPAGFDAARWRPAPVPRAAPLGQRAWRWSAAARRRGRARSRWRTAACCSSTNCPSCRAPRSKRCASRWKPAASRSRAPRGRPRSRRASCWSRR